MKATSVRLIACREITRSTVKRSRAQAAISMLSTARVTDPLSRGTVADSS